MLPAGASLARASVATCCDASGALVSLAANSARFDCDPVGHAARGLLIEPAASNVALNSRDWTQATWTSGSMSPTATTLIEGAGSALHRMQLTSANRTVTSGTPVVVSVIASELAGSAKRYLGIVFLTAGFTLQPTATFDLATGTVTQVANGTAGCVAAPGGWLCWLSATPDANSSVGAERYFLSNSSSAAAASFVGDGTSGLKVSEAQFETGTLPTSRIRAGASTVSRAADALSLNWGSKGVADGAITVRYGFDDGSSQDMAASVSGGLASVPVNLNRAWLRRAEKI